ncbi:MAG: glycosyltransferase [Ilumatobacter sp.]|uniref:glycosyltransferase n=1 Tax=Ilumatobacter sp. TaxID=1967498 RepID=UPI0032981ACF
MTQAVTDLSLVIDSLESGGAEQMLVRLAPAIAARGRTVRVDVLTDRVDKSLSSILREGGVTVETHGFARIADPRRFVALDRYFRSRPVRIIHTQLEASDVVGTLLARRLGVPAVSTQHVFGDDAGRRADARTRVQHVILRHLGARTIAVSNAGREHLIRTCGHRPENVVVIPNGIDLPPVPSPRDRRAARQQLELAPTVGVIMCCAVLRPAKGIQRAVEAMAALGDAHLVVIGDGPDRAALERLADRLGVAERVHFLGRRTDVMEILPAADVFVHPTLQDVLPTVIIEAMASQLPVVASNTGGVPELVLDGSTGTLVTPDLTDQLVEAIAAYLEQPNSANEHGAAGRARAAHLFTLGGQVDRLLEIYDRATSPRDAG